MDDEAPGPGWWKASDGNWYPPEQRPAVPAPPPPGPPGPVPPGPTPSDATTQSAVPPGMVPPGPVISGGPLGEGSGGGGGMKIAAIAVALVLIAGIAVFVMSGSDGGDDDGQSVATQPDTSVATTDEDTPSTDEPRPTTTDEPATTTTEAAGPSSDDECRYEGVDFADDVQVELEFTNPLGSVPSLDVTYALTDGEGVRFITGSEMIDAPQRNEQFRISSDTVETLPASVDEPDIGCTILEIAEGYDMELEEPGDDATCEFVELDFADDMQFEATVTNPYPDTVDLNIYFAMRGPDDVRFDTGTQLVEVVGPDEVVRAQLDTFTDMPSWLDADELTCEVIALGTF